MAKTILVVEDEVSIATLLKYNLEQAGFNVLLAHDGKIGLQVALKESPDLLILDLMLPTLDGMEICKELRSQKKNIPIIMLTARDDEFDKVLGLELGADDYMTKPFSPREVIARVKAVLRRTETIPFKGSHNNLVNTRLSIDFVNQKVKVDNRLVKLTPIEYKLLVTLVKNKNQVVQHSTIIAETWGKGFNRDPRKVRLSINRLRIKLNDTPPQMILSKRGSGYIFKS